MNAYPQPSTPTPNVALRAWMDDHGHSPKCLAQKLQVTRQAVSAWLHGSRIPRGKHIARLERLSGGLLSAGTFYRAVAEEVSHG